MLKEFTIEIEGRKPFCIAADEVAKDRDYSSWCKLAHQQCDICPLSSLSVEYCPAAVRINDLFDSFSEVLSYEKAKLTLAAENDLYEIKEDAQGTLFSVLLFLLGKSECPKLKMAMWAYDYYSPNLNIENIFYRVFSINLVRNFFSPDNNNLARPGVCPPEIEDFKHILKKLMSRIQGAYPADSCVNALFKGSVSGDLLQLEWDKMLKELKEKVSV